MPFSCNIRDVSFDVPYVSAKRHFQCTRLVVTVPLRDHPVHKGGTSIWSGRISREERVIWFVFIHAVVWERGAYYELK